MFRDEHGRAQRVAAYGVCTNEARELLLCRLAPITGMAGRWTLPGGGLDFGEHPTDGVVREVAEETGLAVEVRELVAVDSIARRLHETSTTSATGAPTAAALDSLDNDYHAIRVIYRVEVVGGTLRHEIGNSTDRAAWHDEAALDLLNTTDLARLGRTLAGL